MLLVLWFMNNEWHIVAVSFLFLFCNSGSKMGRDSLDEISDTFSFSSAFLFVSVAHCHSWNNRKLWVFTDMWF